MAEQAKAEAIEKAEKHKTQWQLFFLYGSLAIDEIMAMEPALLREFAEAHRLYAEDAKRRVDIDYNTLISILNRAFGKGV